MKQAPVMISTKDLSYICDIFNWNFNASKQFNHFQKEVSDIEVKDKLKKLCNMHADICMKLLSILKGE